MILGLDKIKKGKIAAIDTDGKSLTYGEILKLGEGISRTIKSRSVVLLQTSNNVGGIAWLMGMLLSRNVPLIISNNTNEGLIKDLIEIYKPQFICKPSDKTKSDEVLTAFGYSLYPTSFPIYDINAELSHLLPTSGSTGSPKLVRHKYENIEAAALNISTFFRLSPDDRPLMVLPLHYTMGLSMVFSHLKAGASLLITDKPMTDPVFWKFIKEERATSFTGVPFSYEILDKLRFTRMKLPDLILLTQGGGKMSEELNRKFVEYCHDNGKRWIATYGQSEGTARMSWLPEEYALSKIGSIGIAVPNGELSLRDDKGCEIKESPAEGELCYRGKNVTMGYAQCAGDLAKGDERQGYLETGDIAYRDADGFYYIKGRMGRFLKLYGNRIGLDECEVIVKSATGAECACTGTDRSLIVYLTESGVNDDAHQALMNALHLPANSIEIRNIDSLPKNEAGKILYKDLSIC